VRRFGIGIGQFAGQVDPQDPTGGIGTEFLRSMSGDPGVRLAPAMATRHRRYMGGSSIEPQRYVKPPGGTNTPEALDVNATAPIKRNHSRALGQSRGLPWMSTEFLNGSAGA
jgi:hypothetical protein